MVTADFNRQCYCHSTVMHIAPSGTDDDEQAEKADDEKQSAKGGKMNANNITW